MTERPENWVPTSPDDSDNGWGEGSGESADEQLRERLEEIRRQRPPHASE